MSEPDSVKPMFHLSRQTAKIDFTQEVDLSRAQGLKVLITGGANGLGSMLTRQLCEHGAHVTIVDLQQEAGEKLAEEVKGKGQRATFVQTDVSNWTSQVNAFKTAASISDPHEGLDLVVPCAGTAGIPIPISDEVSLTDDPPVPSTLTIDVTLTAVYYSACLALHYFRLPVSNHPHPERKKHIIFIGSLSGYLELPPCSDYTAAKFGVRGLWKSIRREVDQLGVRTNLIAPTFLPTQAIASVSEKLESKGATLGNLDDAAEAVLRLACTEDISGRALAVGGYGNFDLRDDPEGLDGGIELLEYYKTGAMGRGMQAFKEVLGGRGRP
ncbi:MAG: hypothetical protein M1831_001597 [Alyxoria varia]|nr:MAG: hypothetical protein M1831_001597 [Alyxoria varia]